MSQKLQTILTYTSALGLLVVALFATADVFTNVREKTSDSDVPVEQTASVANIESQSFAMPTSTDENISQSVSETKPAIDTPSTTEGNSKKAEISRQKVNRSAELYPSSQPSLETIDASTRSALVNIQCFAGSRHVRSITASGVLIDSRGIILTNAHVAQYVLLSQSPDVNLECFAYYGSPARPLWNIKVLYVSPTWIRAHAKDITKERSVGTGEFDYALLRVTDSTSGISPTLLPSLPPDTREAAGSPEDTVFVASYPAEFVKNEQDLNALISIASLQELLTFGSGSVDLMSVGGVPGAQSGSSGGAVVNLWGRLIGVITTTSDGTTTAERDLRAISLHYIDKSLKEEGGLDLETILSADLSLLADSFNKNIAPGLIDLLITEIKKSSSQTI